ncbi:hypothetical protein [Bullifex sp.]|nr:hypothetical protein [Bullifex sp.]MDY4068071.1 hypothetical protein [Bullifex sp.]
MLENFLYTLKLGLLSYLLLLLSIGVIFVIICLINKIFKIEGK